MNDDGYGWRDRAIALAALGAAGLTRSVFTPIEEVDLQPFEMQVLVALALGDSLAAEPPHRTGTHWLSLALKTQHAATVETVHSLEDAGLVRWSSSDEHVGEIRYELGQEDDEEAVIAHELPITLTDLGSTKVDHWLARTRRHFHGWPSERSGVDDAVG